MNRATLGEEGERVGLLVTQQVESTQHNTTRGRTEEMCDRDERREIIKKEKNCKMGRSRMTSLSTTHTHTHTDRQTGPRVSREERSMDSTEEERRVVVER